MEDADLPANLSKETPSTCSSSACGNVTPGMGNKAAANTEALRLSAAPARAKEVMRDRGHTNGAAHAVVKRRTMLGNSFVLLRTIVVCRALKVTAKQLERVRVAAATIFLEKIQPPTRRVYSRGWSSGLSQLFHMEMDVKGSTLSTSRTGKVNCCVAMASTGRARYDDGVVFYEAFKYM